MRELFLRTVAKLNEHPEGLDVTHNGRVVARLVLPPADSNPAPEPALPSAERAAEATLRILQARPGEEIAWRHARPAYRVRAGLKTHEILDALRETPGVQVLPAASKQSGWVLRYDDPLL